MVATSHNKGKIGAPLEAVLITSFLSFENNHPTFA